MTLFEAIISGIVQGVTEFLPVSSSGHLVFVHRLFNAAVPDIFFDICLHAATLVAVIIYFRGDIIDLIRRKQYKWIAYLTIGTIPAVLAALLFEKKIEILFSNMTVVSFMFMGTAIVLFIAQISLWGSQGARKEITFFRSLYIGLAQAVALIPGISRSGMTVSTGIIGGMTKEEAFRFSFLLSIPVIAGATIYKAMRVDTWSFVSGNYNNYIAGMLCAFFVGLLSLNILWKVIKTEKLYIFGIYCFLLSIVGLSFLS